jgi:GT2 family glycosyltransferase
MSDPTPDVTVIVLGWNGRAYLDDCLRSLESQERDGLAIELLYVDNGSSDASVEFVRARFPDVRVQALDRNYGYAEGNNIALAQARGRIVVFLNQDTVVHRGCIRALVRTLDGHPTIGACHANVVQPWYPEFGALDTTGAPPAFRSADLSRLGYVRYRELPVREPIADTFFLHGVCIAMRRELSASLDYVFDPDFFAYAEDMDLALRLQLLGLRTVAVRDAVVFHKHTLKTSLSPRIALHTVRIVRNRALALFKVMSVAEFAVAFPVVIAGAPLNVTEFGLTPGRRAVYFVLLIPVALLAAMTTLVQLPAYREKRARIRSRRPAGAGSMFRRLLRQPW